MRRWIPAGLVPAALLVLFLGPLHAQGVGSLDAGIRAYLERGDPRETIRQIAPALDAGAIPMTSRARAHMYLAHAFLALSDTASAVPHIQGAMASEPCMVPAPDLTPPQWAELYERHRPANATCGRRSVAAGLQSLVIPGWGQRSLDRNGSAGYFFGATAAGVVGTVLLQNQANRHYDAYRSSTDFEEVGVLYDMAETSRRRAVLLGGAAVAVYVWNVVDAVRAGAAHDRQIASVRPLAVVPVIVPSLDGATLALQVRVK